MSRSWQGGSTRRWRKVRAYVLQRDGYTCQLRLDGCEGQANEAHHTLGKSAGDNPAFVIAACGPCNRQVGDPTRHDPDCEFNVEEWR